MKTLATSLTLAALALALSGCTSSLATARKGEIDSPTKAFVQRGLDGSAEAYLVCIYQAERTGGWKNEAEIQATVVERIKGAKPIGDRFSFKRASDSDTRNPSYLRGKLFYVFLDQAADGNPVVDIQDPLALWEYTEELQLIVAAFKRTNPQ